ncbi:MAG: FG-GAP-like repeat-containing protein [Bacteroidota bacterium]|nr:FG-GAP-like repeat-containing protein [Bacteroidota bacterium]
MKTIIYHTKKLLLILLLVLQAKIGSATGEPSTYFNIFVPPNNDNVQRNVCLVITAIYDSTSFSIMDDGMDGDTDDSKTGVLMAGQSYILYIKDNGINDDAKYASGGILKQDGDYFIITSNKIMYASQSTNSDWQHDWVPSTNKTGIGQKFIIYAPQITSSNRDLNVFAYQNNTQITIKKISSAPTLVTGLTNVDLNSSNVIVQKTLNIGQDIIYSGSEGRNVMMSGETYVIESDKPITVQYGALYGNERDGGGYVPSSSGSSSGELFYFGVPFQSGTSGEQEIRIVSSSNSNIVNLERYNAGTWVSMKTWTMNANTVVDWVGKTNGNVNYPTVFRVTCSSGKKVSVFEANWLETGNPGTSDIGTMCSSLNGSSSGNDFLVYLAPPGNEQNVKNPFTGQLFGQQLTHVYLFSFDDTCNVTIKDTYTNGSKLNKAYTILPRKYIDCYLTLSEWHNIYNGTGTTVGPERPYITIHSDKGISVMNTNFNDNWMMYFGSSLEQSFSQTSTSSQTIAIPGDTIITKSKLIFKTTSNIDSAQINVVVGSGLKVINSNLLDSTLNNSQSATISKTNNQSTISFSTQAQLNATHNYIITTTIVPQVMYNNGTPISNNTVKSIETIISGNINGIYQQSSSSLGLKIESSNTSNLLFSMANFNTDLTNSWTANIVDMDGDGWEDIFVTDKDMNKPNFIYRNLGGNMFSKLTPSGIGTELAATVCASWADVNNDGKRDVLVVNNTQKPNTIYSNTGSFNFIKSSENNITDHAGYFHNGSFVDYDNDGFLDVFISNFMPTRFNELYHSNGNGTFTQISNSPITSESFMSLGATWADYDNDGDQDLFMPHGNNDKNSFFINTGNGLFNKDTSLSVSNDISNSVGSCWGDVNNDGWLDLFVANASNQNNFLYINNKLGDFTKVTTGSVVNDGGHSHGCSFVDLDNDMDLDLYVTNDQGFKFLYLNDGNGNFIRKTDEIIEANYGKSMGNYWFDSDKDGDLDLFVVTHSAQQNYLFTNNGNSNNWVNIKLIGTVSNKDGIGARVKLKCGNTWQYREVNSQSGLGGQSTIRCHFGLGANSVIDSIIVCWPSGLKQYLANETVNTFKTITEPSGAKLKGMVYYDKNSNCVKDEDENGISNIKVDIDNSQSFVPNTIGSFSQWLTTGTHTVSVNSQANWYSICGNQTITINSILDSIYMEIPINSIVAGNDLKVDVFATALRRGFKNQVNVIVENNGTEINYNAILDLNLGQGMAIKQTNPVCTLSLPNLYTWTIDSILPGQSKVINLLDSVYLNKAIGDNLSFTATVNTAGDINASNNNVIKFYPVVGAIDPNDLVVSPIGEGISGYVKRENMLTYTVRFKNVGTCFASKVVINDNLPFGLDYSKVNNIRGSHKFNYTINNEGLLNVIFDEINLPDSISNDALSNGFISFSIPIVNSAVDGTKIRNQATIQFDYEDPIATNSVLNTITFQNLKDEVSVYPNPTGGVVNLKLRSSDDDYQLDNRIKQVKVYNSFGELIQIIENKEIICKLDFTLNVSGLYFMQIQDMFGNTYHEKLILKH